MPLSLRASWYAMGVYWIGVLVIVVASWGCSSTSTTLAGSGETLKQVGIQFVAVNQFYVEGCKAGQIKPLACANFSDFGRRFRAEYPAAILAWEAARGANDLSKEAAARDVIAKLAADLSAVTVTALQGVQ